MRPAQQRAGGKSGFAPFALWMASALSVIDLGALNILLPGIGSEMHAAPAAVIWIVNASQIATLTMLLPASALGAKFGANRISNLGLALFALAALGCAAASSILELALWRFVQGIAAGAIMAMTGALLRDIYNSDQLGRGVSLHALIVAAASAAGPGIAAAFLSLTSWRWLLVAEAAWAFPILVLSVLALPEGMRIGSRYDWRSAILVALSVGPIGLAMASLAQDKNILSALPLIVIGVAAMGFLIRRSRAQKGPMMPLDLMADPALRSCYTASIIAFTAQTLAFIALPFYALDTLKLTHGEISAIMSAWPASVLVTAYCMARIAAHVSPALLGGLGLVICAAGLLLIPACTATIGLVTAFAVAGAGFVIFQTPNNRLMLHLAPTDRGNAAAGMLAMSRLTGQMLGATATALLFTVTSAASPLPFAIAGGCAILGALICVARKSREAIT
jgi:MFS transporter, DHA2 family, multidrug resistance protein